MDGKTTGAVTLQPTGNSQCGCWANKRNKTYQWRKFDEREQEREKYGNRNSSV